MTADVALKPPTVQPSLEALSRAVDKLIPLVEADADDSERLYHLTDRLVDEFRRAGLYRLTTPRAIGGLELPLVDAMRLVERIAWADGSAGWCMMVEGVVCAVMGAFLPDGGARTIYRNGGDVTAAGNGVPRGFARPVDGGYMIRGHWAYGSTIQHAEWIHSGCFIADGDKPRLKPDGTPEIVLCHHPRSTIVLKGNWDTLGLRGTGSYDYVLTEPELFVPHEMTFPFDGAVQHRGGIQYSAGLVSLTTWGHTSWALGVGRRALDELARHARGRADPFGKLHESASFRMSFAQVEAKYRAARALVYESWESLGDSYARGEHASLEQLALIRLAMRHIHDVISEISTFAHRASRGVSLRPSLLQRCYRDIHSGTQHILLADEITQECGKVLLGTAGPDAQWTMFGVRAPGEQAKGH
jgi:alkylation response protein AidB-like acyl-CoA dehydrogenase